MWPYPNLSPFMNWLRLIIFDQLHADLENILMLLPRADLSLQDEMQVAFHPTRQPGLVEKRATRATSG